MQKLENPTPIVARAECDGIIEKIAAKIKAPYAESLKLRKQQNDIGIHIGRVIAEACRDAQIEAQLAIENSREKKMEKGGGTDIKVYCFVAMKVAKETGYNAEYLKWCARQYLAALNEECKQKRLEPVKYLKGGAIKIDLPKNEPLPELKQIIVEKQPKEPRMDALFQEPGVKPPEKNPEELAEEFAASFIRSAKLDERPVQPTLVKAFAFKLAPYFEKVGLTIQEKKASKNGGNLS